MSLSRLVYDDIYEICRNHNKLINWLQEQNILTDFQDILCDKCCSGYFHLVKDKSYPSDQVVYRCTNRKCNCKKSIRTNSWFAGSHLTLKQIVKLTYYWVYKLPQSFVEEELRIGSCTTLVDWYSFAREVCLQIAISDNEQIGGDGVVVEIDESKFGKSKYNRGRRVDGCWVFGGIERVAKKCFFQIVDDRSAETLIPIIRKFIKKGSIIHSDCWKSYSCLEAEGYSHFTVNHSKEFADSETGAHTQTIESTWHALKSSLPKSGTQKQLYDGYFWEYVIRKKYLNSASDKFLEFFDLIKKVYNPNSSLENKENSFFDTSCDLFD